MYGSVNQLFLTFFFKLCIANLFYSIGPEHMYYLYCNNSTTQKIFKDNLYIDQ